MGIETEQQDLNILYEESKESTKPQPLSFENIWTSVMPIEPQEDVCSLCGKVKALAYEKNNQGYTMRICEVCAIAYMKSAEIIDSKKRLESKSSATKKENCKNIAKGPGHFLVRVKEGKRNHWIDIQTGTEFEKLDVPYEKAQHGLCEKTGRIVLKKVVDDGFEPLVFIAKELTKPTPTIKPITVKFHDADKHITSWRFEPYEVSELRKGLEEGLSVIQLAIRVCAPIEAVENVLNQLGGDKDGVKRHKIKKGRKDSSGKYSRARKDGR